MDARPRGLELVCAYLVVAAVAGVLVGGWLVGRVQEPLGDEYVAGSLELFFVALAASIVLLVGLALLAAAGLWTGRRIGWYAAVAYFLGVIVQQSIYVALGFAGPEAIRLVAGPNLEGAVQLFVAVVGLWYLADRGIAITQEGPHGTPA